MHSVIKCFLSFVLGSREAKMSKRSCLLSWSSWEILLTRTLSLGFLGNPSDVTWCISFFGIRITNLSSHKSLVSHSSHITTLNLSFLFGELGIIVSTSLYHPEDWESLCESKLQVIECKRQGINWVYFLSSMNRFPSAFCVLRSHLAALFF